MEKSLLAIFDEIWLRSCIIVQGLLSNFGVTLKSPSLIGICYTICVCILGPPPPPPMMCLLLCVFIIRISMSYGGSM